VRRPTGKLCNLQVAPVDRHRVILEFNHGSSQLPHLINRPILGFLDYRWIYGDGEQLPIGFGFIYEKQNASDWRFARTFLIQSRVGEQLSDVGVGYPQLVTVVVLARIAMD